MLRASASLDLSSADLCRYRPTMLKRRPYKAILDQQITFIPGDLIRHPIRKIYRIFELPLFS